MLESVLDWVLANLLPILITALGALVLYLWRRTLKAIEEFVRGTETKIDDVIFARVKAELEAVIRGAAGELFRSAEVFDVFEQEQLGEGKKSVAFHVIFGAADRTLESDAVTALQDRVVTALETAGYPLR